MRYKTELLIEETGISICERNPGGNVRIECSLHDDYGKITLIIRDDGSQTDIADGDLPLTSMQSYLHTRIISSYSHLYLQATGLNRTLFEISGDQSVPSAA